MVRQMYIIQTNYKIMCDIVNLDLRCYAHKHMQSLWQNIKCARYSPFYLWFEYQQHRWVHLETSFVKKKIFTKEALMYLRHNNFTKLNLMDKCAEGVFDADFLNKMDAEMYLIGFENGVYDFKTKKFRDGHPDDCITLSVGYAYLPVDDKQIHDVTEFFNVIQPDKEVRDYLLSVLSTCLVGPIINMKMHVLTGLSGSGKHQLIAMMKHMLGDYFVESDRILFESGGKRMTNHRGRRMCLASSQQKIKSSHFKLAMSGECVGEKSKYGYTIHRSQLKLFMVADNSPSSLMKDLSLFMRLCDVPFLEKIDASDFTDGRYESIRLPLFCLLVSYYDTYYQQKYHPRS